MFTPDSSALLDGVGEYIRDSTTVNIIDNDCTCFSFITYIAIYRFSLCTVLEINFRESKFVLEEGSTGLCSPIVLEFQNNQNPFNVTLSRVSWNFTPSHCILDKQHSFEASFIVVLFSRG